MQEDPVCKLHGWTWEWRSPYLDKKWQPLPKRTNSGLPRSRRDLHHWTSQIKLKLLLHMLKQEDTFVSTTMFVHKALIRSIHIFPGCILESVSGWLYVLCQSNESVYTFCRITKSVFLRKTRQQLLLYSESYLCLKITRNRLPRSCYTEWYWEIYCFLENEPQSCPNTD